MYQWTLISTIIVQQNVNFKMYANTIDTMANTQIALEGACFHVTG